MILLDEQRKLCVINAIKFRYVYDKQRQKFDRQYETYMLTKTPEAIRKAVLDQIKRGDTLDLYSEQWGMLLLDLKKYIKHNESTIVMSNLINDVRDQLATSYPEVD